MNARPVIVGLGGVLWDVFPDGAKFGGAPANFACTAAGLARGQFDVHVASAVGDDELGRQAIAALQRHGVDTSTIEQVENETGQVHVIVDAGGHANYRFASDTAWDYLPWNTRWYSLAQRARVICFGTLGQRKEKSRETIRRFLRSAAPSCLRLLDINLRSPFWDAEVVLQSLELADAIKLNDAELPILAEMLSLTGSDDELLGQIMEKYSLRFVALTRGDKGSLLLHSDGHRSEWTGDPVQVVDTVGAGDAFTAALAIGLLRGMPLADINRWASDVAAFVCTQAGATPVLPDRLYSNEHYSPSTRN